MSFLTSSSPSFSGGTSGFRPVTSSGSAERSAGIEAERAISRLYSMKAKGAPKPAGAGFTDKIPRGKAVY